MPLLRYEIDYGLIYAVYGVSPLSGVFLEVHDRALKPDESASAEVNALALTICAYGDGAYIQLQTCGIPHIVLYFFLKMIVSVCRIAIMIRS